MSSEERNIKKLGDFCNNLGKCFRKLTEDTDDKFKKFEERIKVLEDKNKMYDKMLDLKNDDLHKVIDESCAPLRDKLDTLYTENLDIEESIKAKDEEISNITKDMTKVKTKLEEIE